MTSRAFQPNTATPLNTEDRMTITPSRGGTIRMRNALIPHTKTERAGKRERVMSDQQHHSNIL